MSIMWNYPDETYTDKLRAKLAPIAYGKKIAFRYRRLGKTKKVSGRFKYLSHTPGKGFAISMAQVKWLGHYWGAIGLRFWCRDIVWTQHYDFMVPLLEVPTVQQIT